MQENQSLRQRKNIITDEINKLKKQGEDIKEKIQEAKDLPAKIKQGDERLEEKDNEEDLKMDFFGFLA